MSDLDRLNRGLKKQGCDANRLNVGIKVMRQLAEVVRHDNWNITVSVIRRRCANEILEVRPGNGQHPSLGLAIDVGTTTIVVYLVDMADGTVLAATTGHNRQADCGDDLINRIVCAEKDGVKKLSRMALATINSLIGEALDSAGAQTEDIRNVVLSGNTTMAHLLLQIDPRYIRRDPYIPTVSDLKNLIYSKGAVYAGFTTLLGEAGMDFSMVDRMIITGGFGQYLNIEKAVTIGLLPDIDRSKFSYMGNASVVGAYMALLSGDSRQEARQISNSMTYVDFSSNPRYMDQFTSALFLPHTDLNAFPRVVNKN